ncbi:MAG: nucleotide exchange factor GrpE [Candidatus Hydrogenedentes bacterium]|nr:nucleotide exchange factor GrpE [Candidatus Hydrogenedentota bacterium]
MRDFKEKTELEKKWAAAAEEASTPAAQDEEAAAEAPAPEESGEAVPAAARDPREDELAALESEVTDLRNQLLRGRAEFDNYRKRMAREREQDRKLAAAQLMRELLPVADNLERALGHAEAGESALAQGVDMVLRQLSGVLQAKGLEPIPAVGERFDPNVHEALAHQPSDEHEPDIVTTEYERGYRIGDHVLRPSKVVVSSGPAAGGIAPGEEELSSIQAESHGEE